MRQARRLPYSDAVLILWALIPVVNPHALAYDAVFSLPALIRTLLLLEGNRRNGLLVFTYLTGCTWIIARSMHFNPLCIATIAIPFLLLQILGNTEDKASISPSGHASVTQASASPIHDNSPELTLSEPAISDADLHA